MKRRLSLGARSPRPACTTPSRFVTGSNGFITDETASDSHTDTASHIRQLGCISSEHQSYFRKLILIPVLSHPARLLQGGE